MAFKKNSYKNLKRELIELEEFNMIERNPDSIIVEPDFPTYLLQTNDAHDHNLSFTLVENVRY